MIIICRFYFLSVYDSVNIIFLGTGFVSGSDPVIFPLLLVPFKQTWN